MKERNYGNNRAARRWLERNSGIGEYDIFRRQHDQSHTRLAGATGSYNAISTTGVTVAESVYHKGIPAENLLDAMTEHSRGIDDGWQLIHAGKAPRELVDYLQYCTDHNPIAQTHKGVSIDMIADMPSPLTGDDIRKINTLFYVGPFRRSSTIQKINTRLLANFAVQSQLPGPHPRLSARTRKLQTAMTQYFDYWTEVFTNSVNLAQNGHLESDFLRMVLSENLLYTTIAYIPARLGISPSSAMELFEEFREMSNYVARRTLKKRVRTSMAHVLSKSYLPSQVPEEILPFILPNTQNSENVSDFLEKEISIPESENEQFEIYSTRERAIKHLNSQILPNVLRGLRRNNGIINLVPQEPGYITKIQIAQQYPKATIVILHLRNGSHLTLDITTKNHIYGFPHRVRQQNPNIEDQVIVDIVSSITEELRRQRELIRESQAQTPTNISPTRLIPSTYVPITSTEQRPRRVKTRGEAKQEEQAPESVEEPVQQARVNFVAYDESFIKNELGGKASPKTIHQISNALYRFGYGEKSTRLLESDPTHRTIRLRAGDFRIVLRRIEGNQFEIVKIGDRKDVYSQVSV